MLDVNFLDPASSDFTDDIFNALHDWVETVYSEKNVASEYYGFALESSFLKVYDFEFNPAKPDPSFETLLERNTTFTGVTIHSESSFFNSEYSGCLVLREKVELELILLGIDGSLTSAHTLSTLLHELGHMWAPLATDGGSGDCGTHTITGNGKNYVPCLWHAACVKSPSYPISAKKFVQQAIDDPRYCEGHQQFFMNQLKVKW